ncbi:MAG: hypothetical protein LN546_06420, partial [Rickettsia endosymbiont of Ecitomorpha arachnoides]|nr:hypothetical protein [Rickettsia endosymbiont of Ecitomorpha arachnoides]
DFLLSIGKLILYHLSWQNPLCNVLLTLILYSITRVLSLFFHAIFRLEHWKGLPIFWCYNDMLPIGEVSSKLPSYDYE